MTRFLAKHNLSLVIIGILLIGLPLQLLLGLYGRGAAWDMTDGKRYSLAPYSIEQVSKLDMPLYITVYYSPEINRYYGRYPEYVMRFLRQYQRVNPVRVFITVKNPQPYSEAEKEAQSHNLSPYVAADGQQGLYFGATFANADGKSYTLPAFSLERSFWLEKDVTTIVARFTNPERKVVGLISPVHKIINRAYGGGDNNYAFAQELSERYDILQFAPNIEEIPDDVTTLVVVAPDKISESLHYALEQYVLRGGNLILALDKLIEEPFYKTTKQTVSQLNHMLQNWGLKVSNRLLGSEKFGQLLFLSQDRTAYPVAYPLWLDLPQSALNPDVPFVRGLHRLKMRSATEVFWRKTNDDVTAMPLISLSEGGGYPVAEYSESKEHVISTYKSDGKEHHLGWWLRGRFQSVFVSKPAVAAAAKHQHLFYSVQDGNVMILGDSDMLRDDVWLEGEQLNDNGQLLMRAVEYFNGYAPMAMLYKSQSEAVGQPLGKIIYNRIYQRHVKAVNALENRLRELAQEQETIMKGIRSGSQLINVEISTRLDKIRSQIKDGENNLRYYDYQIKQSYDDKLQSIIFVNTLVVPVAWVVLLILGWRFYETRCRRKIKEKYHAGK